MAELTKRRGTCPNFNNGCTIADSKKIIDVDITEDFVCPECQSDLTEIIKTPFPKWIIAVIAAVVLGGGGIGAWMFLSGDAPSTASQEITLTEPVQEPTPEPEPVAAADSVETKAPETTTPEAKPAAPKSTAASTAVAFSGKLRNGYPNGTGTLTFKQARRIDLHDEKARTANAGDYIIGEWDNGHLIQGRWYDSANTLKETIVLGKAMNPEKDHTLGKASN